jgi:hypothetical protein
MGQGSGPCTREGERRKKRRKAVGRLPGERKEEGKRRRGAGWAGPKGEKRGRVKERKRAIAFEFEYGSWIQIWIQINSNQKYQCKEHEMHNHMVFPIFIFIL